MQFSQVKNLNFLKMFQNYNLLDNTIPVICIAIDVKAIKSMCLREQHVKGENENESPIITQKDLISHQNILKKYNVQSAE